MNSQLMLWAQVAVFLAIFFYVGAYTRRWINKMSDFYLAGRELHWLIIASITAAILISGAVVPASSGFGYRFGFSSYWYIGAWCVSVSLAGLFFARYWRRVGTYTIPEWFEMKFGLKTRMFYAGFYTIATALAGISQVVGLGITIEAVTGVPYQLATWAAGTLYLSYIFFGGFWATAINSFFQGIICSIGMILLMIYLMVNYGGVVTVARELPPEFFQFPGGMGWGPWVFFSAIGLLWGWICCVWPQQYYFNNTIGARTEKHAVRGLFFAGVFALLLYSWTLPTVGIYARIIYPGIAPEASFGRLVADLPMGLNGLILLVVISGAMSTACPIIISTSSLTLHEIYKRLINPTASQRQLVLASRICTLIVGFLIILAGSLFPGTSAEMLAIFFAGSSPLVPAILAMMFWPKVTKEALVISSGMGLLTAMGWLFWGPWEIIHGMWIGLFVSAPLLIIITFLTQDRSLWHETVKFDVGSDVDNIDIAVMDAIRKGRNTQDKVIGMLSGEAVELGLRLKKLENLGYLQREGDRGVKFLKYIITDAAIKLIPVLSREEEELLGRHGISMEDMAILNAIDGMEKGGIRKVGFANLAEILSGQMDISNLGPSVVNLIDRGYINEYGLFKVSLTLPATTREILSTT